MNAQSEQDDPAPETPVPAVPDAPSGPSAPTPPGAPQAPDAPAAPPAPEPPAAPDAPGGFDEPDGPAEPDVRTATVRRAPKWSAFIVVGMLLGLVVTIAVTTAFPADPMVGMTTTVLVVGIFGVAGGAALGAIAALIADRASQRRVREVTVERGAVHAEPAADEPTGAGAAADEAEPDPDLIAHPDDDPDQGIGDERAPAADEPADRDAERPSRPSR